MARYPGIEDERRIDEAILNRVVVDIFSACGMSSQDAWLVAASLVHADLRGIHSHGVMRVPVYVGKLLDEGVDPKGQPRIEREQGAALVVDGANAMGQVAVTFAMRAAIERAERSGVCTVAIGNSNHCGAMDYYALMASEADMIGIATTNALPTMAPYGGADRILGINPIGIAVPAGAHPPVVLDTSFGATARGRIEVYQQKELALPEGWAMDSNGRPTTDPAVALGGLIAPAGGHKGSGLAVMTGLLSTILTGAAYGTHLGNVEDGPKAGADGQFVMVLNPAAFDTTERVKERTDGVVDEILKSRRAPGFDAVLPPGRLESNLMEEFAEDGIPLNQETIENIHAAAKRLGTDVSALDD
jgi:LDH2 family malate/lactate/ureidoglycolate dehydrogenase